MAGAGNSINESTTGICGFTGTAFTGSPASQYTVQVGGATTSTLVSLGTGSSGQVLQSKGNAANPAYSTPTYPSASGTTGTILRSDGTNNVYTTATYPATTTINQILFSSAANTIAGITAVIDGVMISDHAAGLPSFLANGTAGYVLTANSGAPPSWQANASAVVTGTFTPTLLGGSTAGSTTYSTQTGAYAQIGSVYLATFSVTGTAATGTGSAYFGGFPGTFLAGYVFWGSIISASAAGWTWPASTTTMSLGTIASSSNAEIYCSGSGVAGNYMQMHNAAFNFQGTLIYRT